MCTFVMSSHSNIPTRLLGCLDWVVLGGCGGANDLNQELFRHMCLARS